MSYALPTVLNTMRTELRLSPGLHLCDVGNASNLVRSPHSVHVICCRGQCYLNDPETDHKMQCDWHNGIAWVWTPMRCNLGVGKKSYVPFWCRCDFGHRKCYGWNHTAQTSPAVSTSHKCEPRQFFGMTRTVYGRQWNFRCRGLEVPYSNRHLW